MCACLFIFRGFFDQFRLILQNAKLVILLPQGFFSTNCWYYWDKIFPPSLITLSNTPKMVRYGLFFPNIHYYHFVHTESPRGSCGITFNNCIVCHRRDFLVRYGQINSLLCRLIGQSSFACSALIRAFRDPDEYLFISAPKNSVSKFFCGGGPNTG